MAWELDGAAEVVTACALCQNEDCGSLVISYPPAEMGPSTLCNFVCAKCGTEFSLSHDQLVFQAMAYEELIKRPA